MLRYRKKFSPLVALRWRRARFGWRFVQACGLYGCLIASLSGCYYFELAKGQAEIVLNKQPTEQALQQESWAKYRPLLQAVPEIKRFGHEVVGLKATPNFEEVYQAHSHGMTHVLTAAPKFALVPYEWNYFWVGKLPFRGYFSEESFQKMQRSLEQQGYEVWSFYSVAYSTLGWFKDPVTSAMLDQGLFYLAETILHEMVHETMFIENAGDTNEQLASFIGHRAALDFIGRQPQGEKLVQQQLEKQTRGEDLEKFMRELYQKADTLYKSDLAQEEKERQKEALFRQHSATLAKMFPNQSPRFYQINNARLLQWRRYNTKDPFFAELFQQAKEDWPTFFKLLPAKLEQEKKLKLAYLTKKI